MRINAKALALAIFAACALFLFSRAHVSGQTPARATIQVSMQASVHYAPAENLERIDVALLDAARERIDFAAYVLTDIPVIMALEAAAKRGVKVRIFRDRFSRDPGDTVTDALEQMAKTPGIEIRRTARGPLMHLKSYAIDGAVLRTGSANFSASGLKQQENDLIILRDAAAAARFEAMFARLWRAGR